MPVGLQHLAPPAPRTHVRGSGVAHGSDTREQRKTRARQQCEISEVLLTRDSRRGDRWELAKALGSQPARSSAPLSSLPPPPAFLFLIA